MNFNLSLTSFESDIAITHNLLKFALTFFHYTHFVFTSSIAVTSGWDSHQGVIPESVLNRADVLEKIGNGYAGAKYVVEHVSLFFFALTSVSLISGRFLLDLIVLVHSEQHQSELDNFQDLRQPEHGMLPNGCLVSSNQALSWGASLLESRYAQLHMT